MSLPLTIPNILGLIGAVLFVVAYAGMHLEKLDPHGVTALLMNLIGAVLVLISLAYDFNLPSFVLETIWGLVAAYGLIKLVRRRR